MEVIWIIVGVLVAVFIGAILFGGDKEDAIVATGTIGMAGIGCAWELFWMGASIVFFLWVVQSCFG